MIVADPNSWPCPHCGYDLRGIVEVTKRDAVICPECGRASSMIALFDEAASPPWHRGWRWFAVFCSPALLIAVCFAVELLVMRLLAGFAGIGFAGAFILLLIVSLREARRTANGDLLLRVVWYVFLIGFLNVCVGLMLLVLLMPLFMLVTA